mgnify:CR=1 FL=1
MIPICDILTKIHLSECFFLFLVADKSYGYLDSNKYARENFEELSGIHKGEKLPWQIEQLFKSEEEEMISSTATAEKSGTTSKLKLNKSSSASGMMTTNFGFTAQDSEGVHKNMAGV